MHTPNNSGGPMEIENLVTSLGLSQIISEPPNFEPNKKPCVLILS